MIDTFYGFYKLIIIFLKPYLEGFLGQMDNIQLASVFLISFFLSRLMLKVRLPQLFLYWVVEKKKTTPSGLLLYLFLLSAVTSTVLPNMITVLALLPIMRILQNNFPHDKEGRSMSTAVMLAVVYGSNCGGVGSITGAYINGFMVGFLNLKKISGYQDFSFYQWLIWGIPLMLILVLIGWFILVLVFDPKRHLDYKTLKAHEWKKECRHPQQKLGLLLIGIYFVTSCLISYELYRFPEKKLEMLAQVLFWTIGFLILLFVIPFKGENHHRTHLLSWKDLWNDIPYKGLIFLGVLTLGAGALIYYDVPHYVEDYLARAIDQGVPHFGFYLVMGGLALLATEILSNAATQISMFTLLSTFSMMLPINGYQPLLLVGLVTTCAFMTPIATPGVALAFGSSGKIRIGRMLMAGFFFDIAALFVITAWVYWIVPLVLGTF